MGIHSSAAAIVKNLEDFPVVFSIEFCYEPYIPLSKGFAEAMNKIMSAFFFDFYFWYGRFFRPFVRSEGSAA